MASTAALERLADDVRDLAGHIELIAKLVERINTSNSALARLDAVEQRVTRLDLEYARISSSARPSAFPPAEEVGALAREVDEVRQAQTQTQDSLETVRAGLEQIMDRLTTIETEMRSGSSPSGTSALRAAVSVPLPASAPTPSTLVSTCAQPAPSEPEEASLSTARPLTPPEQAGDRRSAVVATPPSPPSGSGPLRALDPSSLLDPSGASTTWAAVGPTIASGSKLDFIAAARRAVQAAGRQGNKPAPSDEITSAAAKPPSRFRIFGALIGVITVILLLFGGLLAKTLRSASDAAGVQGRTSSAATHRSILPRPSVVAVTQRTFSLIERPELDLATPEAAQ